VGAISTKFQVLLDAEVLERLATHLEILSGGMSTEEWAHLLGLLGLGCAAICEKGSPEEGSDRKGDPTDMGTPGFADVLSPVADLVLSHVYAACSVVIESSGTTFGWKALPRRLWRSTSQEWVRSDGE